MTREIDKSKWPRGPWDDEADGEGKAPCQLQCEMDRACYILDRLGALKYPSDAAALVGIRGSGTVRNGHPKKNTVWHEGHEEFSAGESYDGAAAIMIRRMDEANARFREKFGVTPSA